MVAVLACAAGCVTPAPPLRRAATPDTIAALRTAPRVIAVHYHETGPVVHPSAVYVGAPAARVKARLLDGLRARLGPMAVRDVAEPRFPYLDHALDRAPEPSVARLQRTYRTGYVLDVYTPWRWLETGGPTTTGGTLAVRARLVRLDDLAVLWAHHCEYPTHHLSSASALSTAPALREADACADVLLADFLAGVR